MEDGQIDVVRSATIGFVLIDIVSASAKPAGSGTLMSFGGVKGILTCAHVAATLQKEPIVGIVVLDDRPQKQALKISPADAVILGHGPWSARGPDLAFLRLEEGTASAIAARATIINGDKQMAMLQEEEPKASAYYQAVAGVIGDRTAVVSESPTRKTVGFQGLISRCVIRSNQQHGDFDILELRHDLEDFDEVPENYRGTSGGGLWLLYFSDDELGKRKLVQTRVIGVAFWEREDGSGLNAHGRSSIYDVLHRQIVARWPDAAALK